MQCTTALLTLPTQRRSNSAPQMIVRLFSIVLVLQGVLGKVLPKPAYLLEQDQASPARGMPSLASKETLLVLWMPHKKQVEGKKQSRNMDKDQHMRPGNDRLLLRAWTCLHHLQQV